MAWFILARLAFIGAVAYSAFMLRPLGDDSSLNLAFGTGLGLLSVAFEWQLRNTAVTHMLGAFIGGAAGLLLAKGISAAMFWVDHGDQRVAFLHSFILLVFPYLGLVIGARKGEWLEPARLISLFRSAGRSVSERRRRSAPLSIGPTSTTVASSSCTALFCSASRTSAWL